MGSHGSLLLQVRCDFGELGEGDLEIFHDLKARPRLRLRYGGGENVGIGEVSAVFQVSRRAEALAKPVLSLSNFESSRPNSKS